MLKITWVLVALHNVNGFEVKQYTQDTFKTAGECVEAAISPINKNKRFECARLYNGQLYISQPSWMSNEQALKMVQKQELMRETLKLRAQDN